MEEQYYTLVGKSIIDTYKTIGFILLGEEEDEAELGGSQRQRRFPQGEDLTKKVGESLRKLTQRGTDRRRKPQVPFARGEERRGGTPGRPGGEPERRKPK
tara:strand:- start:19 stop:318 length:300 start_codon:yes stop_codon:yes gene_type:complete